MTCFVVGLQAVCLSEEKRMFRKSFAMLVAVCLFAAIFAVNAGEGFFPDRPITLVVGSAPGGGADMHGRTFSDLAYRNKFISDPMVITYQLGGTGQVAFNYVVSRNDDPYTLMITNTSYPIAAALNEAPIRIEQLGVLGVMAFDDYFLCVRKDSPYKSVQDIVDDMKKRPNEVRWSGGLIGAIDHFAFEKFKKIAGVEGPYVGFDGQSDSVTALLGGHIDVGIFTPFACAGQLASGDFIPLATWSLEPIPGKYSNLPTLKSLGYDVECRIARGILCTPNMPKEAFDYYEAMVRKIMDTQGWKDYVAANSLTEGYMNAAEARQYLIDVTNEVVATVKEGGLY